MSSLDEVLRGEVAHVDSADGAVGTGEADHTGETQQTDAAAGESQAAAPEAANDAPPASEQGKTVPLEALEAERKGRQDWKEKAIRNEERGNQFERELAALRAQMSQTQAQQPQQPQQLTPEMVMLNERFNISEMMAREKYSDLDEKFEVFQKAAADNPALGAELARQKHPYDWMYKHAQKLQALAEIGDDPTAYEQKLREKIMAELQAAQPAEPQQPATQAAVPVLPKSLATNRSAAPRSAAVWTGPTPLDNILKR